MDGLYRYTTLFLALTNHQTTMRQETTNLVGVHDALFSQVTGKSWDEWKYFLDHAKASDQSPDEIRTIIRTYRRIQDELENLIIRAYLKLEADGDLLPAGEDLDFTSTLTVNVPLQLAESAFTEPSLRRQWLSEIESILRHNPGKNLRFAWNNDQIIVVTFIPKGPSKCQISLQHTRIGSAHALIELKAFWKNRLQHLAAFLQGND